MAGQSTLDVRDNAVNEQFFVHLTRNLLGRRHQYVDISVSDVLSDSHLLCVRVDPDLPSERFADGVMTWSRNSCQKHHLRDVALVLDFTALHALIVKKVVPLLVFADIKLLLVNMYDVSHTQKTASPTWCGGGSEPCLDQSFYLGSSRVSRLPKTRMELQPNFIQATMKSCLRKANRCCYTSLCCLSLSGTLARASLCSVNLRSQRQVLLQRFLVDTLASHDTPNVSTTSPVASLLSFPTWLRVKVSLRLAGLRLLLLSSSASRLELTSEAAPAAFSFNRVYFE